MGRRGAISGAGAPVASTDTTPAGTVTNAPKVWNGTAWVQGTALVLGGAANTPAADSVVHLDNTDKITSDGAGALNLDLIHANGDAVIVGDIVNNTFTAVKTSTGGSIYLYGGTRELISALASGIKVSAKVTGDAGYSDPLNFGYTTQNCVGDVDQTLSAATMANQTIEVTDTGVVLTGAKNVVCTTAVWASKFFANTTARTLTFKTLAGTGIAIATARGAWLFCDGTNVRRMTADSVL
jgi:hypothetical protein